MASLFPLIVFVGWLSPLHFVASRNVLLLFGVCVCSHVVGGVGFVSVCMCVEEKRNGGMRREKGNIHGLINEAFQKERRKWVNTQHRCAVIVLNASVESTGIQNKKSEV